MVHTPGHLKALGETGYIYIFRTTFQQTFWGGFHVQLIHFFQNLTLLYMTPSWLVPEDPASLHSLQLQYKVQRVAKRYLVQERGGGGEDTHVVKQSELEVRLLWYPCGATTLHPVSPAVRDGTRLLREFEEK